MDWAKHKITELRRDHLSLIAIYLINLLPAPRRNDKSKKKRWRERLQDYRDEYIKWRDEYIRGEGGGDDDTGGLTEMIRKLGPTNAFPLDASQHRLVGRDDDYVVPQQGMMRQRTRDLIDPV